MEDKKLEKRIHEAAKGFRCAETRKWNFPNEIKAFEAGANFILKLILPSLNDTTRWRDVNEELPEVDKDILLKGLYDGQPDYDIGYLHTGDNHIFISGRLEKVTHWRPIESDLANELLTQI